MKRHLHFPLAGLVLLTAGVIWSTSATAQMTGFVVEVDTVFYGADTPTPEDTFDLDGTLDGYASFIVYADVRTQRRDCRRYTQTMTRCF